MIVRTRNEANQLWIEIEDNGIGVEVEHQSRLFDANFTTKTSDEGTGLGLGISRRFVRTYGGDIEFVSSTSQAKTIFRIRMPLHAQRTSGAVA